MRTSTFPLYDRLCDGQLAQILSDLTAEGLSQEEITWRLRERHDVHVSKSTVRRWIADLESEAA